MFKPLRRAAIGFLAAGLFAVPSQAALFSASGTFSWSQVSPNNFILSNSADNFNFNFLSDSTGGQLTINRIDVVIGSGLFPDPTLLPAGYLSWGNSPLLTYGGATYLGTGPSYGGFGEGTGPGARDASGYFSGLGAGSGFNFYLDLDQTGGFLCGWSCDDLTASDFIDGGALTYEIYFQYAGQDMGSFSFSGFTPGEGSQAISEWAIRGVTQEEDAVPEPATYALLGASLVGIAFLKRRSA